MDEEVESMHLKFLQQPPVGWTYVEAVERFNANVSYSGLLHAVTGEVKSQELVSCNVSPRSVSINLVLKSPNSYSITNPPLFFSINII